MYGNLRRRKKSPFRVFAGFAGYTTQCSGHILMMMAMLRVEVVCVVRWWWILLQIATWFDHVYQPKNLYFSNQILVWKCKFEWARYGPRFMCNCSPFTKKKNPLLSPQPVSWSSAGLFSWCLWIMYCNRQQKKGKRISCELPLHTYVLRKMYAACYVCMHDSVSFYPNKFSIYYT